MSDARTIDPELLTEELAVISRKTKKTDEDKALLAPLLEQTLSAGAKTYLEELAAEFVYGYEKKVSSKYLEKGIAVEDDSIALYGTVTFTEMSKNTERRTNEWITGECDLLYPSKITDIKSSWSMDTFPKVSDQGRDADYEWQGRGYMMLWDKPAFEIAYCLVNTPEELIGYEDPDLHYVDHINPALRVTTVAYTRDMALEERIKVKVASARRYIEKAVRQIVIEHGGDSEPRPAAVIPDQPTKPVAQPVTRPIVRIPETIDF